MTQAEAEVPDRTLCLGIAESATGRAWLAPDLAAERLALAIEQTTGLAPAVSAVLADRGVLPEEATPFLAPSLRDLTPDPSCLRDMDLAADLLVTALRARQRIAIFGDYDVDGACSTALLHTWLTQQGNTPTIYIPDRIDEGYGPNVPAMEELAKTHDLIICVDCGTLSHEPVAAAKAAGAGVLILDHHLGGETLPDALAVVNPNRQDESDLLSHLCAAGVVFLLLVAANRLLRNNGAVGPDLLPMLDLVALATVADVAPLQGLNRAFVRQGCRVMASRERPGLAALADVAGLKSAPASYHLGYVLGPRINAGGRIGAPDLGARLLTTGSRDEADAIAQRLHALNKERQEIEGQVLAQAREQAEERGTEGALVWAAGEGWHPGVVGIVASRLKEAFNRPAVVIGFDGDEGKGSGRSVGGIDLGHAIARLARDGLLLKGGGHKMAAGLTVARRSLDEAMSTLDGLLARQGAQSIGPRALKISGILNPMAATIDLVNAVEEAGPFGAGASAPRFVLPHVTLRHLRRVGDGHLQIGMTGRNGDSLNGIAFRVFESELGTFLESRSGDKVHVAGRLEVDEWGGRRQVKMRVEDAALPV